MKTLVTAGMVYGRLDDNKLVGNRSRGIWALLYARHLVEQGHDVTVLVPDIMDKERFSGFGGKVIRHCGFDDYLGKCLEQALKADAAIMAAAVVNWIPENPVSGKMPTEGFEEGDVINIPFKLAPRVIEQMRKRNPDLTLIGCKMLSGSSHEDLLSAAGNLCHKARCHAVVANDLAKGLRAKHVVMPDLSVHTFDYDFENFYGFLDGILNDVHYRTTVETETNLFEPPTKDNRDARASLAEAKRRFDLIVERNRAGFVSGGNGKVFGSVAVRILGSLWLVSPREKGGAFTSNDAVMVFNNDDWKSEPKTVTVFKNMANRKATLNAPLLIRAGDSCAAAAVIHQHSFVDEAPTEPYAPPGTVRDNDRKIPGPVFNIAGHGFVSCFDEKDLK